MSSPHIAIWLRPGNSPIRFWEENSSSGTRHGTEKWVEYKTKKGTHKVVYRVIWED